MNVVSTLLQCFQNTWDWRRFGCGGVRTPVSLKLDLAGAAAEASQQGLSGDLWKGGATNQTGAHDQVNNERA